MKPLPDILCIGTALWDVIGRAPVPLHAGADMPGRMTRQPGGVALNLSVALARQGIRTALLAAVGRDGSGKELVANLGAEGVETTYLCRPDSLPTDSYMAIEDPDGLIGAIADSHTMEAVGLGMLAPLTDGRLGTPEAPYRGMVALDGGLAEAQLADLAESPILTGTDLRLVPVSSGKATRLAPFLNVPRACFYVNLEEAGLLCGAVFADSASAAQAMLARGAARALVTHGAQEVCDASLEGLICRTPPRVQSRRVTGAGDTFMATHMAQEFRGASRSDALEHALATAAAYVASDPTC